MSKNKMNSQNSSMLQKLSSQTIRLRVVQPPINIKRLLIEYIDKYKGQPGIICVRSTEEGNTLEAYLRARHINVAVSYAPGQMKDQIFITTNLADFRKCPVNVRFMIHISSPKSLGEYLLDIGSVKNDLPCEVILYFKQANTKKQWWTINKRIDIDNEEKIRQYNGLQSVAQYANTSRCLRKEIARYLGGDCHPCHQCSNCLYKGELDDITLESQTLIALVKLAHGQYNKINIAQIVTGSRNQRILENGAKIYEQYGALQHYSQEKVLNLIDYLIVTDYLEIRQGRYLFITTAGLEVLENKIAVKRKKFSEYPLRFTSYDKELFEKLRLKRLELAKETKVAPFIVFTNTSLNDMVRVLPQTSAEFLTVEGVGKYRLEHYGDAMMAIIKDYLNEKNLKAVC